VQQAEGYKQQVIALTQGEAQRFIAIQKEYKQAPEVTRRRIYIDTMQSILAGVDKVILDTKAGPGVVPYLPLPQLRPGPTQAAPSVAGPAQAAPSVAGPAQAAPSVAENEKGR
jgi:modulator of FtsH protease HflK